MGPHIAQQSIIGANAFHYSHGTPLCGPWPLQPMFPEDGSTPPCPRGIYLNTVTWQFGIAGLVKELDLTEIPWSGW